MPGVSQPQCNPHPSLAPASHSWEKMCTTIPLCLQCPSCSSWISLPFFFLHPAQFFHFSKQKEPFLSSVLLSSQHLVIYPPILTTSLATAIDSKLFWGGGRAFSFSNLLPPTIWYIVGIQFVDWINKRPNQWPELPRALTHFRVTF